MRLQINYPLFTIYSGEPGTFPNNEFIVENTMIEIKIFCNNNKIHSQFSVFIGCFSFQLTSCHQYIQKNLNIMEIEISALCSKLNECEQIGESSDEKNKYLQAQLLTALSKIFFNDLFFNLPF